MGLLENLGNLIWALTFKADIAEGMPIKLSEPIALKTNSHRPSSMVPRSGCEAERVGPDFSLGKSRPVPLSATAERY